ncbi:MAG: 4-hydroxy-tetrahydrodipicolinate synthase [Desulfobacterales bacterium]|nr:MAG: 4-hydroxy-tetrahydrodipicolinate synthase [Desulfobacterales bacterium]
MINGCHTAIITPFDENGVDREGMARLVDFQVSNGVSGVLAVGTTGESPVLDWEEHNAVIGAVAKYCKGKCTVIAGTGSNNTAEALKASTYAVSAGVDALLLVDPYYNGPSSLEIRREYLEPVAAAFPDTGIIPYIIPGRTGCQLLPEDIALAHERYPNIHAIKEATGSRENMKRTRELLGREFRILSGDDPMTCSIMLEPGIRAAGGISVMSNIAPKAMSDMIRLAAEGKAEEAEALDRALSPLTRIVMIRTREATPYGDVECRARNPLPVKILMNLLGMPSGPCRPPLGKITPTALEIIAGAAREVWEKNPEILTPAAKTFDLDLEDRLSPERLAKDPAVKNLVYDAY